MLISHHFTSAVPDSQPNIRERHAERESPTHVFLGGNHLGPQGFEGCIDICWQIWGMAGICFGHWERGRSASLTRAIIMHDIIETPYKAVVGMLFSSGDSSAQASNYDCVSLNSAAGQEILDSKVSHTPWIAILL